MSEIKCVDCGKVEKSFDKEIRDKVEKDTGLKVYEILCGRCNLIRHKSTYPEKEFKKKLEAHDNERNSQ
jgi:hypothetical protein